MRRWSSFGISLSIPCASTISFPFTGKAHVAYIPQKDRLAGLSKLARVVEAISRRPQLQERITTQVADTLMKVLKPQGVFVIVEAEHLCMTMRGVKKPGFQHDHFGRSGCFPEKRDHPQGSPSTDREVGLCRVQQRFPSEYFTPIHLTFLARFLSLLKSPVARSFYLKLRLSNS